ncbi:MAG: hypothetical protein ACE5GT_11360 [Rhodospirillales bacterium]
MTASPQPALRDARLDDALEITRFLARLGLVMPEGDEAARAHWEALWRTNPALAAHGPEPALGWVLEDEGRIVGFFGNIPQASWFRGERVRVSSARAWAVDEAFRTETPRLCEAFFGQEGADLVLISSASAPAGRRCLEFGGQRMPQPDYDQILYWVLDASRFLRAGFRKKGRGPAAAWLGGAVGALALNARMRLGGRRPFAPLENVTIARIDEIDDAFDDLWRRKLGETPERLLACRDAATLRWYFGLSRRAGDTRVVCCRRNGRLDGYAVLVRDDNPGIGLERLKIADLFVAGDDGDVVDALLTAAYEYGLAKHCHVLELIGLPPGLRARALAHKPYRRAMATFPFFYKALDPALAEALASGDGWYVTAFDGDTQLL